MSGNQLPVLTLDIDEEKIRQLNEISEKFKAGFGIGPGGFPTTIPGGGGKPIPGDNHRPQNPGNKRESGFDSFLKNLNKQAQGTLKTFGLINKTLGMTTGILKELFTTTLSWGAKIAALGAGGILGFDMLAKHATQNLMNAQGLGMTNGQTQAAHSVYGSYFSSTDETMQALANAKNPASKEFRALRSLDLDPTADAATNLPKFYEAIERVRKTHGQNALAALGGMGVDWIGANDLNQVGANSEVIPKLGQMFRERSGRLDNMLSPEDQRRYQGVSSNLTDNASQIGNSFLASIARLSDPINQLSDSLTKSITGFLNGPNGKALFETIATGFGKLAAWLGSESFQKDIDDFSKAIGDIGRAVGRVAAWINGIFGDEKTRQKTVEDTRKKSSFEKAYPATATTPAVPAADATKRDASFWGLVKATGQTVGGIGGVIGKNMFPDFSERVKAGGWANYEATRGLRNNNPGNLNFAGQRGATLENGPNARFAQFPSMLEGVAALDRQVQLYLKRGTDSIDEIVDIYAPKADGNDTAAYKSHLSRVTGLSVNDEINSSNTDTVLRLIRGIIDKENGAAGKQVTDADIRRAYDMNRGAQTQTAGSQQPIKLEVIQNPGADYHAQVVGNNAIPR